MTKAKSAQGSMVGLISGNLRELRKRGLTAADLLALEKLAILCANGRGKVRISDLGRLLGIGRSGAHKRVTALVAAGVVVTAKLAAATGQRSWTLVALNVRGLLAVASDALKGRAGRAKELFSWQRIRKQVQSATDTRQVKEKGYEKGEPGIPDRLTALAELKLTYVPPHLRRCA